MKTPDDGYCREESCQWRHWRSGSVTHRRGEGCPAPETTPDGLFACGATNPTYPGEYACTLPTGHEPVEAEGTMFEHAAPGVGAYWNLPRRDAAPYDAARVERTPPLPTRDEVGDVLADAGIIRRDHVFERVVEADLTYLTRALAPLFADFDREVRADERARIAAPGPLRMKFDGGRAAMLNEADQIVGYYPQGVTAIHEAREGGREQALAEIAARRDEVARGILSVTQNPRYVALAECQGHPAWTTALEQADAVLAALGVGRPAAEVTICEWCPSAARGSAWHNDGRLHPSCGQPDHGSGWVPVSDR